MPLQGGIFTITQSQKITNKILSTTINPSTTITQETPVPTGKTGAAVTVRVTYNTSATNGAVLNIYYSQDGVNYDTNTDQSFTLPFTAGSTVQKTYIIPTIPNYLQLAITNNDSTYSIQVEVWITFI